MRLTLDSGRRETALARTPTIFIRSNKRAFDDLEALEKLYRNVLVGMSLIDALLSSLLSLACGVRAPDAGRMAEFEPRLM